MLAPVDRAMMEARSSTCLLTILSIDSEYRELLSFPPGEGFFFFSEIKPPGGKSKYRGGLKFF